ncbi:hypothetical protein C7H19_04600 [Aphanothece hegewaldii CCALA 016]|uniref:Uncharacterized protein n=1 Tax=Aphanothece hegewaldii CCALA 016 TaxID=2107694 RepID=A0A2T1M242_9CHRO|nr:hypothetical protein [Aphanothece hegewaldii]PSF38784.1 hypothetical protein C7H19_04600 [Aphanothece hegewaldii CCALA 016]
MLSPAVSQAKEQIIYPDLPLAIYREIATHLMQVNGVQTLLIPQDSKSFDYQQSQIKALVIQYHGKFKPQIEAILNFYASRYGAYQRHDSNS